MKALLVLLTGCCSFLVTFSIISRVELEKAKTRIKVIEQVLDLEHKDLRVTVDGKVFVNSNGNGGYSRIYYPEHLKPRPGMLIE